MGTIDFKITKINTKKCKNGITLHKILKKNVTVVIQNTDAKKDKFLNKITGATKY